MSSIADTLRTISANLLTLAEDLDIQQEHIAYLEHQTDNNKKTLVDIAELILDRNR